MGPVRDYDGSWIDPETFEILGHPQEWFDKWKLQQRLTAQKPKILPLDTEAAWRIDWDSTNLLSNYGRFPDADEVGILNVLKHNDRILDLGCNDGHTTTALRRLGFQSVGIDISQDLLVLGKKNQSLVGMTAPLIQGSFYSLPFEDQTFQLVLGLKILHLNDFDHSLQIGREAMRVVSQPGYLVFTVNSANSPITSKVKEVNPDPKNGIEERIVHDQLRDDRLVAIYFWSKLAVVKFCRIINGRLFGLEEKIQYQPTTNEKYGAWWKFRLVKE